MCHISAYTPRNPLVVEYVVAKLLVLLWCLIKLLQLVSVFHLPTAPYYTNDCSTRRPNSQDVLLIASNGSPLATSGEMLFCLAPIQYEKRATRVAPWSLACFANNFAFEKQVGKRVPYTPLKDRRSSPNSTQPRRLL